MLCTGQAAVTPYALLVYACLVLAGCSDSQRFEFAGARDDFCVPNEYLIDDPIWLTRDIVLDDGGFAWTGCGDEYKGLCVIPNGVQGGIIGPIKNVRWHRWDELPTGTAPREVTLRALSEGRYRVIPDSPNSSFRLLVTPSTSSPHGVFYWRIGKGEKPTLDADTVLLARCDGINPRQSPNAPEIAFQCSRSVIVDDIGLDYRFETGTITSSTTDALDRKVIAGINKWRCPKRKVRQLHE